MRVASDEYGHTPSRSGRHVRLHLLSRRLLACVRVTSLPGGVAILPIATCPAHGPAAAARAATAECLHG